MDRIFAAGLLLFGVFWAWQGSRLQMVAGDGGPGPGVLPTALGLLIAALAVVNLLRPELERVEFPNRRRVLLVLGSLIAYAALLEPLGYVLTTFLFLAVLLMALAERRRWWQPVSALAVSLGTYALFRLVLAVPLPPDPFDLVR